MQDQCKGQEEHLSIGALLKTLSSLVAYVTLIVIFTMIAALAFGQSAQTPSQQNVAPGVPRLVKFSAQLKDASGKLLTDTVGVMFAIYGEQTGGVPLWQETQNVYFSQGRYTVLLGNSTSTGIPAELFASGQPQWLGVRALLLGEEEQPRVLLASVPYALKAVDADTLGGLPPSSYLRADSASGSASRGALPALGTSTDPASTSAGSHIRRTTTNGEENGQVSITHSSSANYAFTTKWALPPVCTLTPTSDPHALGGYWVTSSTSTMTANVHYAGQITFNFRCEEARTF